MRQVNILFLGGAKRVSMARMFIDAGRRMGLDVNIFSYELEEHVPIACVATVIKGLRWNDPDILPALHSVVETHNINIMVPFIDMMVGVVARYLAEYHDVFAPVSDADLCEAMFDKITSAEIFRRQGIPAPATYIKGRPEFPLIAKPRNGSASKGIKVIKTPMDFRSVITPPNRYLIQEYISDREEYTVDCYVARDGEQLCISPRRRLDVVGGEVSRTATVHSPRIVDATAEALRRIGLVGAVTVQFLLDRATDRLLIMEINPRLGGGAVCSVHAGCDIPAMILAEATGSTPTPATPSPDVEIARYFQEVVFKH